MQIKSEQEARRRIRELVQQVKAEADLPKAPCYLGVEDPTAKHLGIAIEERSLPLGDEGQYIPTDPPVIVISPLISDRDRLNFTFFHEISHHLIKQDDELYSFIHEYASANDNHFDIALERYCNVGAAEFLIPFSEVRKVIDEQGFSMELIEQLEVIYPASKPAMAIQLAQCARHKCFIVVCLWGVMPQNQKPQTSFFTPTTAHPELYVLYASSSPSAGYSIGRFVSVPDDHVIALAYKNKNTVKDIAPILFRSGNRNWRCECEAFYYKGKVYAVFNASQPTPIEQLSLF
jgi:Zn-dependent peptidase ImmA (M78 family)